MGWILLHKATGTGCIGCRCKQSVRLSTWEWLTRSTKHAQRWTAWMPHHRSVLSLFGSEASKTLAFFFNLKRNTLRSRRRHHTIWFMLGDPSPRSRSLHQIFHERRSSYSLSRALSRPSRQGAVQQGEINAPSSWSPRQHTTVSIGIIWMLCFSLQ